MKWMARAMATDWRWPPESFDHRLLEAAEVRVEPVHHLAAFGFHGDVVKRAEGGLELAAKIEVGGGIDIVGKRQRLVDRLDAERLGIARIVDVDFLAVDEDLAVVALVGAGQDLDQRRLAGAVVAEKADDFAGIKIDRRMVDGLDAAEGDRDVAHLDQRRAAFASVSRTALRL